MVPFSKLWPSFVDKSVPSLTKTETAKFTDFDLSDPPMEELFLVEDGVLVGATATFDDSPHIHPSDPTLLPKRYKPFLNSLPYDYRIEPKFEEREAELSMIRKATCQISVEKQWGTGRSAEVTYRSATAFFIGPVTLLTAGHVLRLGPMGRAELPGKAKVERDSEERRSMCLHSMLSPWYVFS